MSSPSQMTTLPFTEAVEMLAAGQDHPPLRGGGGAPACAPRKTAPAPLGAHRVAEEFYQQQLASPKATRDAFSRARLHPGDVRHFGSAPRPGLVEFPDAPALKNFTTGDRISGLGSQVSRRYYDVSVGASGPSAISRARRGFGARRLDDSDEVAQSTSTPRDADLQVTALLYGLDLAKTIATEHKVVIVEGLHGRHGRARRGVTGRRGRVAPRCAAPSTSRSFAACLATTDPAAGVLCPQARTARRSSSPSTATAPGKGRAAPTAGPRPRPSWRWPRAARTPATCVYPRVIRRSSAW